MTDMPGDRRGFLKLAAGAALGAAALPPALAQALAAPARPGSGTIEDVEHVVILMQENRGFDHYFGTLRGVRGFGDPRAITLPGGQSVFLQPRKGGEGAVGPFRLDSDTTKAQTMFGLDHSWKGSHARWKHHDAWVAAKGPMTMGYFTRADLPFYYALADAFTVCDAYHCSVFGPTNPNRLYLFSGTSGLAVGDEQITVVDNPPDELNETADPARDSPKFEGLSWPTYAERLQAAGITWRLYQEYDNYGDNGLAYFKSFRGIGPDHPLHQRGRAWAPGSTAANARMTTGEPLVAQFAADVAGGTLPQVSWIVAPYRLCEHPNASPAQGQHLVARLLEVLASHSDVWSKTVFILNYDENDGYFDHVPPPLPAAGPVLGKSTAPATGEVYRGEPLGLGPRVPMLVVSPWTTGGYVNSQVFDHTSVIRFLEARFGVHEPHISPWRRTVAGDLTSLFDFGTADAAWVQGLPDASIEPGRAEKASKLPQPKPAADPQGPPRQEPGQRPARALPYQFEVAGAAGPEGLALTLANTGAAGAAFNLYAAGGGEPRFYTVGAGKQLEDLVPVEGAAYDLSLHGPNGFLRGYRGAAPKAGEARPEAQARFDPANGRLLITLRNLGEAAVSVTVAAKDYLQAPARRHRLAPGAEVIDAWDLKASHHWYDFVVTAAHDPGFERRIAGHGEDGRPSLSDPALSQGV